MSHSLYPTRLLCFRGNSSPVTRRAQAEFPKPPSVLLISPLELTVRRASIPLPRCGGGRRPARTSTQRHPKLIRAAAHEREHRLDGAQIGLDEKRAHNRHHLVVDFAGEAGCANRNDVRYPLVLRREFAFAKWSGSRSFMPNFATTCATGSSPNFRLPQ